MANCEAMPCLLLDTNVWLEKYLPQRPQHLPVVEMLGEARHQCVPLAFPTHSVLDVYQNVLINNKHWARQRGLLDESMAKAIKRLAWDCVNDMREYGIPVPADSSDLYLACKHRDIHDDLEDDLVVAACQRSHAKYLVTLDRKLLSHAPIEAVTPQRMTEILRAGILQGAGGSNAQNDYLLSWLKTL